jgi:hypothetical protein
MGGPWRAKGFDAAAWVPPVPRIETGREPADPTPGHEASIVIAYLAGVALAVAVALTLLRAGWL